MKPNRREMIAVVFLLLLALVGSLLWGVPFYAGWGLGVLTAGLLVSYMERTGKLRS